MMDYVTIVYMGRMRLYGIRDTNAYGMGFLELWFIFGNVDWES